jgi:tRNA(Ile)-lysidine synthase
LLKAAAPEPLGLAEFAAALDSLARFERHPLVAVATSGGPDSLALAILADRWARERGGEAWAVTIDHQLRPESAAEIDRLRGWLAARGIPHEVLAWAGPKPKTGIQQAAREARYRLLAAWCRRRGCLHLLTAHHREDQAETYLIRRRAGSGPDGLAGMSAVRELDGCLVLRPLLGFSRDRLVAVLNAIGQPFISDPSNRNPAFERTRLRDAGLPDIDARLADIAGFGHQRIVRERARERLLARGVALHPAGFAVLDPALLAAAPPPVAEAALAALARTIGAARYPIRGERIARLRAALTGPGFAGHTIGGCRFVAWRGRVLVFRELAAAAPAQTLHPGGRLLWDRRFAVALPGAAAAPVRVGYLAARVSELKRRPRNLPRLLHAVLPAVWDDAGLLAVPHLGHRRGPASAGPRLLFRPLIPLIRAAFTVVCSSAHPISSAGEDAPRSVPATAQPDAPPSIERRSP